MDEKEEKMTQDKSQHVGGSAIGTIMNTGNFKDNTVKVSGTYTTTAQTITIDKMYLKKMPKEYSDSLQSLTTDLNKQLEKENVSTEAVKELQSSANEVAKETAELKPGASVSSLKKISLSTKLAKFARAIVKASPKFAEKIVSMTPLAPFSELIGDAFEKIVADVLKENPATNQTS